MPWGWACECFYSVPLVAWTFACGLRLAGNLVFSPSPRPAYPLTGVFIVVRAFVSLNCLTRAREIAANTWEREQGSYLLKEGTVAKWSREGDLGRIPFSSEIQHTLRPFRKALGVVGPYLGWCICSSQVGVLSTMTACSPGSLFWAPADVVTGLQCPRHCGSDETNSQQLLSPVEEKGQHGHSLKGRVSQSTSATLSRGECPTLALTGFSFFSFFSGHITLRMVLI